MKKFTDGGSQRICGRNISKIIFWQFQNQYCTPKLITDGEGGNRTLEGVAP